MWIESTQLPDHDIVTDVCIVGTGPAGLTVARQLGADREVWMLEAGTTDDRRQEEYRGEIVGLPYFDLDACRTRRFGGSSNSWGGHCRAFEPLDFEPRPRIPYSGWPIRFDEVLPFYQRAHLLGRLGPVDYSDEFRTEATGQPSSPFRGRHVAPGIQQRSQFDPAAVHRDLTTAPNVRVCVDATVTSIDLDAGGRHVTSITFADSSNRRRTIRAKQYVLAAGGIENPRLLLLSNAVQKHGLGNDHDQVGRFFMEHVDYVIGSFRPADPELFRDTFSWHAAGGTPIRPTLAIAEPIRRREQLLRCFFHVGEQSVERTFGYRSAAHLLGHLRSGRPVPNLRFHLRNLWWDRQAVLAAAAWRLKLRRGDPGAAGVRGLLRLRVTAEPTPNPSSRVMLASTRDRYGLPKVALDWRIDPRDREHVSRSLDLFAADVGELRLGELSRRRPDEWPVRGTFHHMGTTRMSESPRSGVVDGDCRVHGIANLYIAGSSVFPTAGSGTPTLMVIVLALRLGEHLATRADATPIAVVA